MRVVGGRLKGRNLASPSSRDIRPTADRLRESVFNILVHAYDDPIDGCARARSLRRHRRARHRGGVARRGVHAVRRQWRGGARAAAQQCRGARRSAASPRSIAATPPISVPRIRCEPFSLAFLDPPYGKGLAEKALASLREGGWLTPGALLVVEEAKAAAFAAPDGFEELERRAYDDTEFVFLRGP